MKSNKKTALALLFAGLLVGCNADKLEVNLKTDEIRAAAQG